MSILPIFAPPSSFRVGLRAILRSTERSLVSKSSSSRSARPFSTGRRPTESCFQYSDRGVLNPSRALRSRHSRNALPWIPVRTVFRFRAITQYNQLDDSYEDATGLPFRKEDLTQKEVNGIFGAHISARQANELLKIVHGRRVAGTLDDPNLEHNTAHYSDADKIKALEYLRKHIPVDEVVNAGLRAEDELQALEEQEQGGKEAKEQPEETSPQNSPSEAQDNVATAPTGRIPRKSHSNSPYGESTFDRIRAKNIAEREAKEKQLEEERLKREEEEAKGKSGTLQTQQQKPRELSPFVKKYTERATSHLEAPPEMKAWERLLPSFAMTILVCAACAGLAMTYSPPKRSERLWPDVPPAAATCLTIIGLNLLVWTLWKYPPAWPMLNRYFLVIAATPRPLQLVASMFSHHSFSHVAVNMLVLWFFGPRLHDEIGRGNFLALYLASGTVGFGTSLANLVLRRGLDYTTHGASGAIYGVVVAFFWRHRFDEFKLFGYPPDPLSGPQGLGFIGLLLGLHIVGLFSKRSHVADLPSHLGGMVAGAAAVELIQRRMDYNARVRAERLKSRGVLAMEGRDEPSSASLVAR
ncbi:hypothetical protein F5B20DRAFT_583653 [Whalleya microplaca]|nr:hypothetical protein F5B20DRAFT_583653 [Whalleya microplaca]